MHGSERSSSENSLYTSGAFSYGSTDSDASSSSPRPAGPVAIRQRRTRRRISESQLAALETLFGRTTHPSQAERDVLAKSINMYVLVLTTYLLSIVRLSSVSIWPVVETAFTPR